MSRQGRRCGLILSLLLGFVSSQTSEAQNHPSTRPGGGIAEITASGQQRKEEVVYLADKDVDVHYLGMHLQADHVEYNTDTTQAVARGHVLYDYQNEHLEADEAQLNVASNKGQFRNVRGSIHLDRRPNPLLLVSENALYFEAQRSTVSQKMFTWC